jgi:alpha-1,2-mannosyltransferase
MLAAGYLVSAAICCLLAARGQAHFVDLHVYRLGGDTVVHGTNLYQARFAGLPFTYPPFAAVLCVALAVLPWNVAVALITGGSVAMLVLALYLALRLRPLGSRLGSSTRWKLAFAVGAAAIWLEPVRTAIGYGQIDLVIVACVLYDLSLRDDAAHKGVAIGIVAGLKLTPAIFVPYLLLTRRYRAAATATAAFASTVAIGWIALPGSSLSYWDVTFLNPGHIGRVQDASNQSLLGVLARNFHSAHVTWFWLPLALIVAAAGIALAVSAANRGDDVLGFCLCAITGLLISPISWTHHWVIAVPAVLLVAVKLYLGRSHRLRWVTIAGSLALTVVAAAGWAGLARRTQSPNWLHLPAIGLVDSEIYVVAGLVALATAAHWRWSSQNVRAAETKTSGLSQPQPNPDGQLVIPPPEVDVDIT